MTTKQKAFHDWMNLCCVDLLHIASYTNFEEDESIDEYYLFEIIPSKQKAFYDWMNLCAVDLKHIDSCTNDNGVIEEYYLFENIPISEIIKKKK